MDRVGEGFISSVQEMGTRALDKASKAAQKLQEHWSDPRKTISDRLDKAVNAVGDKATSPGAFLEEYKLSMKGRNSEEKWKEVEKTVTDGLKSGIKIVAFVPITAFKLIGLIPNMIRRGHEAFHSGEGIAENTKAVLKGALLHGAVKPAAKTTEGLAKDLARFGLLVSVGALGCYHNAKSVLADRFPDTFKEANVQFSKNQIDAFNKAMGTEWTKEIGHKIGEEFRGVQEMGARALGKAGEMGTRALDKAGNTAQKLQEHWSDSKKTISDRLDKAVNAVGEKATTGAFLRKYSLSMKEGSLYEQREKIKTTVAGGLKSGIKIVVFAPITAFKLVGLIPNMIRRGHEAFHPGDSIAENTKAVLKGALLHGAVKPAAKAAEGLVNDLAKFGLLLSVGVLGCYYNAKNVLRRAIPR